MAKSLSQRIADRAAKEKKPSRAGMNRAAFLATRPEIVLAIRDGWPLKTIWEQLRFEGKLTFGYDAFLNYVRKTIEYATPAGAVSESMAPATPTKPNKPDTTPKGNEKQFQGKTTTGFTLNPFPTKEDIL